MTSRDINGGAFALSVCVLQISKVRRNSNISSLSVKPALRQTSATVPALLEMARKTSIARHGWCDSKVGVCVWPFVAE